MQIFNIYYSGDLWLSRNAESISALQIDMSTESAMRSLCYLIPGATLSSLIFIVFGTTRQLRFRCTRWTHSPVLWINAAKGPCVILPRCESAIYLANINSTNYTCSANHKVSRKLQGSIGEKCSVAPLVVEISE